MALTATAASLLKLARDAGAQDYDMTSGSAATSKLIRLRLPNGRPIVIQTNNKVPRIWMLPEHEGGTLAILGRREPYDVGRGRHGHLAQVREFRERALVKIEVMTDNSNVIGQALAAAASAASK